jgi:hypothetical protein
MSRPTYGEHRIDVRCGNLPRGEERIVVTALSSRAVRVDGRPVGTVYGFNPNAQGQTTTYAFRPDDYDPEAGRWGVYGSDLAWMRRSILGEYERRPLPVRMPVLKPQPDLPPMILTEPIDDSPEWTI